MMQAEGFSCIEYAAGESESEADTKISLMSADEHARYFKPMGAQQSRPDDTLTNPGYKIFDERLKESMPPHVAPGDIVCHFYGYTHQHLVASLPQAHHIEVAVGYFAYPFGAWRIFDSEACRHYNWGQCAASNRNDTKGCHRPYSWVIPNGHDPADWPVGDGREGAVVYFGRMDTDKGMPEIAEMIREHAKMVNEGIVRPLHFAFAGRGDFDRQIHRPVHRSPNPLHKDNGVRVTCMGPLSRADAARFIGSARCLLIPTQYVEPLGNVAIQAMLTGTPVISSNFGGFTEIVRHGVDGFRCSTLGDYLAAIHKAPELDRSAIAAGARERFSTEVIGKKYAEAFNVIRDLSGPGWYSRESHRIRVTVVKPETKFDPQPPELSHSCPGGFSDTPLAPALAESKEPPVK
jgi:glycosyltransferase involved in cell wall biosynthesis